MAIGESVVATLVAKLILNTADFVKSSEGVTKNLGIVGTAATTLGATVTNSAKDATKAAMDFETAFTGVRKTVDAPAGKDENAFFEELRQGILGLSAELPVTATEIAGVYQAAGQLGIQAENLDTFSKAMLQLASATNLSSDEAATKLAQFANVMGTDQTLFENMGSAIVALGNNFATNEAQIVSFAQEMGIAGKQSGISEADILGFGTAMASLGLDAASSGTAFQRFTQTLTNGVASWDSELGKGSEQLDLIAKTANMSAEDFKKAWETDATGAIQAFLSGLGELKNSEQLNVFDQLEIGQQQEITMLQSLASNIDLTNGAIEMSNKAWEENTALSVEAGTANATTASQLQMVQNQITELAIVAGETLLPIIRDILEDIKPLIDNVTKFVEAHPNLTKGIIFVGIALGILGSIITTLLPIVTAISGAGGIAAIGTALGGVVTAALPVIAIIALVAAVFLGLKWAIENNFLGLGDRFEELKQTLGSVKEAVSGYWNDIKAEYENNGLEGVLVKLGEDSANLITSAIEGAFNLIGDIGNSALKLIQDAWTNISTELESWDFVQKIKGKWEELSTAFDENGILGVLETLKNDIGNAFNNLWENSPIKTAIDAVTNGIKSAFEWLSDILVGHSIIPDMINDVINSFSGWWESISPDITGVKDGIINAFNIIWEKVKEIADGIVNKLKGAWKWVKKLFGAGEEENNQEEITDPTVDMPAGMLTLDYDTLEPIPEDTLTSYQLLADAINSINMAITGGGKEGSGLGLNAALAGLPALFTNVLTAAQNLANYLSTGFVEAINLMLAVVCMTTTDEEGNVKAGNGNTLYNALGAVYGLLQDILVVSRDIADFWSGTFVAAAETLRITSGKTEGVLASLSAQAYAAAEAFAAQAAAIWAVIGALQVLSGMGGSAGPSNVGSKGKSKLGDSSKKTTSGNAKGGFAPPKKRASGGPVSAGDLYWVGEEGPELYSPSRSGYIIPNDKLASGQTINVSVAFNGDVIGDEKSISGYVTRAATKAIQEAVYAAV